MRENVAPFSGYYADLMASMGLRAEDIRSVDDLRRLPFTTKLDLLNSEYAPKRGRELVLVPDEAVLRRRPEIIWRALTTGRAHLRRGIEREYRPIFLTSTTGRSADPVAFLFSRWDLDRLAEAGRRIMEVGGARTSDRMLNLFPYAPHLGFWQAYHGGEAFGVFMLGTGGGKVMGTEGNLRLLGKIQPDVVIGMPTFLYHVLHQAAEEGLRLPRLRKLVLGGEKVAPGARTKLRELAAELGAAGIEVLVTYGFTEARMAFMECPAPPGEASAGYHLWPDMGIIEIIDPPSGEPVGEGEPGEIVFTPLQARGTVVLRYRTGDLISGGIVHDRCPHCGRVGPRLVGRISRSAERREMRLDKIKGTLVDFNELEHLLDGHHNVGAWQIELRKRNNDPLEVDELILHVNRKNGGGPGDTELARELGSLLFERAEVRPNQVMFHNAGEMRTLQGVGVQLKEQKLVDHRNAASVSPPASRSEVPPASWWRLAWDRFSGNGGTITPVRNETNPS
jgi:phenylacetate-coenzyme A ligase PaaK-like adenylate-forming protein